MRIVAMLVAVAALCACAKAPPAAAVAVPATTLEISQRHNVRDYGDLKTYQSCSAKPRRELTELEKCAMAALSEDCTPAADCLVTCMSSPDGYKRGGGCYHICFDPSVGHSWQDRPSNEVFDKCTTSAPGR